MKKSRSRITNTALFFILILLEGGCGMCAFPRPKLKKEKPKDTLNDYIAKVKATNLQAPAPGSLWSPDSPFADLASDYRAKRVNDLVVINIVEQTSASGNGAVKSTRTFNASSGLSGLFGIPGPTSGLQTFASPNSSNNLTGQAQTSSSYTLQTSITGSVVAVLPNGLLVIEAQRKEVVDNQEQRLTVRGVIRPGDLATDDSVSSTSISNLEILLNGRGVISDGVRPPNAIIRTILKILEF